MAPAKGRGKLDGRYREAGWKISGSWVENIRKLGGRYRQDTVFAYMKLSTGKEKTSFLKSHALGVTMKQVLDLLWARLEEDKVGKGEKLSVFNADLT